MSAQAAEIYDVRAHLFGLAGRLAASRVSFRDVVELRAMVAEMQEAKDIDSYYPLNVAFHARLVELSGNSRVAELYTLWAKSFIFSDAVASSGVTQWFCQTKNICESSKHCVTTTVIYQNAPWPTTFWPEK